MVSGANWNGGIIQRGKKKLTQCSACVHDASKIGPDRMGSSTMGFPNIGCCS
jgi:hypothetical protein